MNVNLNLVTRYDYGFDKDPEYNMPVYNIQRHEKHHQDYLQSRNINTIYSSTEMHVKKTLSTPERSRDHYSEWSR